MAGGNPFSAFVGEEAWEHYVELASYHDGVMVGRGINYANTLFSRRYPGRPSESNLAFNRESERNQISFFKMMYDALEALENHHSDPGESSQAVVDRQLFGTGYQMFLVFLEAVMLGNVNLLKKMHPTLANFGGKGNLEVARKKSEYPF